MTIANGYRVRKEYREGIAERQRARAELSQGPQSRSGRGHGAHYHPDYGKIGQPRPLAQTFWLFASIIISAIVLWLMTDTLGAAGAARQSSFTSQDLIEMAAAGTTATTSTTSPAAPAVSVSVPNMPQASGAVGSTSGGPAGSTPELIAAPRLAVPGAAGSETAIPEQALLNDPESRGQAALALISYPWQELLPEWTIEFLPETRGLYGLTLVSDKHIEVYVRDNQDLGLLAHVIAHELGHAVDVTMNNGSDRRRWEDSRGIDSEPWWPGNGDTDFSTGAGDFAEAFAAWQVGDHSFRSTLGNPPTIEQEALLAELSVG